MAINLASQFSLNAGLPIEISMVTADLTARDAIETIKRFEGLFTYVVAEQKTYQLRGGITNSDWVTVEGDVYFEDDFEVADWNLNGDFYELEVEHNLGRTVNVIVYESSNVVSLHSIIKVDGNNITLQVPAEPDLRFDGTLLAN